MQTDPDKEAATAHTLERVMGDIDIAMNTLSKAFKVGRLSLDAVNVENTHELELDCKLSTNTTV